MEESDSAEACLAVETVVVCLAGRHRCDIGDAKASRKQEGPGPRGLEALVDEIH